jgi:HD-like signal output (HDOD) protein
MSDEDEFKARVSGREQEWKDIVALVGDLPPMPAVAARAVQLVEDPLITAKKLTDVLANDVALAARILKIANSAMFVRQREISTLSQALMTIGFKSLKGIIVAAAVRQINQNASSLNKMVWQLSVGTAIASTLIATTLQKRYREEIYTMGLLHSLGQIVFLNSKKSEKKYPEAFTLIAQEEKTFAEAEQQIFGFSHTLLGALVAKKWNFSEEICDVILHYCDPLLGSKPEGDLYEKIAIVKLGDMLTRSSGICIVEGYPNEEVQLEKTMTYLGLLDAVKFEDRLQELNVSLKERYDIDAHVYQ